jgi:hypothetical protein
MKLKNHFTAIMGWQGKEGISVGDSAAGGVSINMAQ